MSDFGFEFPVDSSGQWDGFNDPGIEHFTGNPFQHLGREVPQNTIDARIGSPVRIDISLKRIAVAAIPDVESLRRTIDQCADSALVDGNEKASKFFAAARKTLQKRYIGVLQIADSNTTGVKGPCENGKPFFAMMKATGQSRKSDTASGSYGIGKFAPYTVSALRTVFLSTVWADEHGQLHHYVQGKAVLMSHIGNDGKTRRGTGFWGVRKQCQPLIGLPESLPGWLRRADAGDPLSGHTGTTLSIVAFDATDNWQDVLAANIVENFFGAIARGELAIAIEASHLINADTIDSLARQPHLQSAVSEEDGEPEKFENVSRYLRALSAGGDVVVAKTENQHLGECELRLLVEPGLPKRVAVLRNGMLITERFPRLKQFGDFKDFVAVLECHSQKGLALLRAMEPPRHDAFEPDRLSPDRRSQGRAALREIAAWVRDMLKRHAQDPVSERTNLDELAEFFADEDDAAKNRKTDEDPRGVIVVRARPLRTKNVSGTLVGFVAGINDQNEIDEDSGKPGSDSRTGRGGEGDWTGTGRSAGEQGRQSGAASTGRVASSGMELRDVRAVLLGPRRRRIGFTPTTTGPVRIEVQDSGADNNYPLQIVSASAGEVHDGQISRLELVAGNRVLLDIELPMEFQGTMRVVANAI